MKLREILLLFSIFIILACQRKTSSPEFIKEVTGRYLFNSDEVIKVYFEDNELFMNWKNTSIQPLKLDETTFFVKEMNEKIQFLTNPNDQTIYMVLLPKDKSNALEYRIKRLSKGDKTPSEYLKSAEFDKALTAFLSIKKTDSLDPVINEDHINRIGYQELRDKNYKYAIDIFKINVALYPNSNNVYDSLGDAFRKSGDTAQAIVNYKKSLELDSSNSRVKRKLNKLERTDKKK
jgi:tetratricopeptide (TPR) repeat protein